MNSKSSSKNNLKKVLLILTLLLLILVSIVIRNHLSATNQALTNKNSTPPLDERLYNKVNDYLQQSKIEEIKDKTDPLLKQNLTKLRTALFLYIQDHYQLPTRLTDLIGDYLKEIPIEPNSQSNKINHKLDLTGGWYYNPSQLSATSIIDLITHSLRPNIKMKDNIKFNPYSITINRAKHKLYLQQQDKVIKTYPIGIGSSNKPTPSGEFKVKTKIKLTGKQKKTFGDYWIGIDLWTKGGGYGIHGTTNNKLAITQQESKGCIRMKNDDLAELYQLIPIKIKVIIK